jgi:hypothetical protein
VSSDSITHYDILSRAIRGSSPRSLTRSMDPHSAHTLPMLLHDVPPTTDDGFPRERLFNIMKANIYITQVSKIRSLLTRLDWSGTESNSKLYYSWVYDTGTSYWQKVTVISFQRPNNIGLGRDQVGDGGATRTLEVIKVRYSWICSRSWALFLLMLSVSTNSLP